MLPSHEPASRPTRLTGLEDQDRRNLVALIFFCTGLTLGGFALLQFAAGHSLFACAEVLTGIVLLLASRRVRQTHQLELWIYLYLLPLFAFLVYITLMPQASAAAFVWLYLIPLLSYLLLGTRRGLRLSLPCLLFAGILFYLRHPLPSSAAQWIDAGNAIVCGGLLTLFVHVYETRRASLFAQVERQAQVDLLTGADSRSHFENELQRSLHEAERNPTPLVFALMDIDYFKAVNDRYGHEAGDHALRHVCQLLQTRLRNTDSLGRLGGEEFGLLLRHTDSRHALSLLEDLRALLAAQPLRYGRDNIELSATFGLAEWPRDGRTPDELYRCADRRLYQGKAAGRNRVVGTSPSTV